MSLKIVPEESEAGQAKEIMNGVNIAWNYSVLSESRNIASILSGTMAGILKVEGVLFGGIFYVCCMLLNSFIIHSALKRDSKYFIENFLYMEFTGGILVYILSWTISYDIIHLF
jgi:EMC6